MIIFGTGRKTIQQGAPRYDCSYCGQQKTVGFSYQVRYFHVFWIPVFPYNVQVGSQCIHCRQALIGKEMGSHLFNEAKAGKPRPPLSYFSGLLLVALLVVLIVAAVINEQQETSSYLQQPKVGDVYGVRQQNGSYTLYLLTAMRDDSLGFRINDYEVTRSSELSAIRRNHADDYGNDVYYYGKTALKDMVDNKIIVNIRRN